MSVLLESCFSFVRKTSSNSHDLTTWSPCLKSGQNIHTLTAHSHGRHAKPAMNSVGSNSTTCGAAAASKQARCQMHGTVMCAHNSCRSSKLGTLSFLERLRALSLSSGSPSMVSTMRSIQHVLQAPYCCFLLSCCSVLLSCCLSKTAEPVSGHEVSQKCKLQGVSWKFSKAPCLGMLRAVHRSSPMLNVDIGHACEVRMMPRCVE